MRKIRFELSRATTGFFPAWRNLVPIATSRAICATSPRSKGSDWRKRASYKDPPAIHSETIMGVPGGTTQPP